MGGCFFIGVKMNLVWNINEIFKIPPPANIWTWTSQTTKSRCSFLEILIQLPPDFETTVPSLTDSSLTSFHKSGISLNLSLKTIKEVTENRKPVKG